MLLYEVMMSLWEFGLLHLTTGDITVKLVIAK